MKKFMKINNLTIASIASAKNIELGSDSNVVTRAILSLCDI